MNTRSCRKTGKSAEFTKVSKDEKKRQQEVKWRKATKKADQKVWD